MSLEELLEARLELVRVRQRRLRLWSKLAVCWVAIAAAALLVLVVEQSVGWAFSLASAILIAASVIAAIIICATHARTRPDWRTLARQIESRFPQLDGRLLTAVPQILNPGAEVNYLQQRVVAAALWEGPP